MKLILSFTSSLLLLYWPTTRLLFSCYHGAFAPNPPWLAALERGATHHRHRKRVFYMYSGSTYRHYLCHQIDRVIKSKTRLWPLILYRPEPNRYNPRKRKNGALGLTILRRSRTWLARMDPSNEMTIRNRAKRATGVWGLAPISVKASSVYFWQQK